MSNFDVLAQSEATLDAIPDASTEAWDHMRAWVTANAPDLAGPLLGDYTPRPTAAPARGRAIYHARPAHKGRRTGV